VSIVDALSLRSSQFVRSCLCGSVLARQPLPQRSLPTVRLPTLLMSTCFFLFQLSTVCVYPVCSAVPLYIVKEPDLQAPDRKLAAQTLHSSARLGSPDRRVGRCLECWQLRKQCPDTCNRIARHTPLVIGKVRFTQLFYIIFGAHAPYHSSKIISCLTVPTAGMSACKSFYRKKLVGR
jgi:hypothetical protein